MSEKIPIEIQITANVTGVPEVKKLVEHLEKLQSLTGQTGIAMQEAGKKARGMGEDLGKLTEYAKVTRGAEESVGHFMGRVIDSEHEVTAFNKTMGESADRARVVAEANKIMGTEYTKTEQKLMGVVGGTESYQQSIIETTRTLKDNQMRLSLQKRMLLGVSTGAISASNAQTYLTQTMGMQAGKARTIVDSYTSLRHSGLGLVAAQETIVGVLNKTTSAGMSTQEIIKYLGGEINRLLGIVGLSSTQIRDFNKALAEGKPEAEAMLRRTVRQRISLRQVSEMNREYTAQLGATGVAMREFSRNIFWTGLGIMFTSMSIARSLRAWEQLQDYGYNLARATMSVREAQEAYAETITEFGPKSEEARRAHIAMIDTQYRETQMRRQARAAVMQYYMSLGMLVFGMMPTAMRTAHTFGDLFQRLGIIHSWTGNQALVSGSKEMALASAHIVAGTASVTHGGQEIGTAVAVKLTGAASTATAWQLYQLAAAEMTAAGAGATLRAALGDITGLLIFAAAVGGTYAYANWQAEQSMKDFERQAEEWEKRFEDYSVIEALENATKATKDFREEVERTIFPETQDIKITREIIGENLAVTRGTNLTLDMIKEIKGMRGDWTSKHSVYVRPVEPLRAPTPEPSLQITINYPIIREEQDIHKLVSEIDRRITKSSYSRRGRY